MPLFIEIKDEIENIQEFQDEAQTKRLWTLIPKRLLDGVQVTEINIDDELINVAKIGIFQSLNTSYYF